MVIDTRSPTPKYPISGLINKNSQSSAITIKPSTITQLGADTRLGLVVCMNITYQLHKVI